MASLKQVKGRVATAHTSIVKAVGMLSAMTYSDMGYSDVRYVERELVKILGRLEAVDAALSHADAASTNEREGGVR